ncbi:MAG: peptide MFS transporter [Bacteroidia bacterium]|nr:peptide MFS transporter [Bacteroidia bacterium]
MAAAATAPHPKGLYVLFTTEMWERFNFYGMRALLTLFLVNALAFREDEASIIYGGFLGLSYLTPMLGGFIADRFLGNRNCILLGGLTMGIGQLLLFASGAVYADNVDLATYIMWAALGAIILGNGFFKPNISSMVGQLYPKGDNRLDSAFTMFYMGINLGAFLGITISPLLGDVIVGGVRQVEAFKWGFLAAGAAMFIGTATFFVLKNKYVVDPSGAPVGARPRFGQGGGSGESEKPVFTQSALLGAALGFVGLLVAFKFLVGQNWVYAFIYASGLTLAGLIMTDKTLTRMERDRIIVMYFVALFVMFFWACFEQAASSLTFIAERQTDRNILGWEMPPSMVQNANSTFVILLSIPFSLLWLWLGRRNAEPISTAKQGVGLLLLAFGSLLVGLQFKGLDAATRISVLWLFLMYFFHTVGELCLSPIGLSLVSKLAPIRFTSLLMGVWFLANAGGYALAGTLGALLPPTGDKYEEAQKLGIDLGQVLSGADTNAAHLAQLAEKNIPTSYPTFAGFTITNLYEFFMVMVILPAAAGLILLALTGRLKRMMHGVR